MTIGRGMTGGDDRGKIVGTAVVDDYYFCGFVGLRKNSIKASLYGVGVIVYGDDDAD